MFVGAVREALYDRRIDVAVHSLKDLPTAPAAELEVAANPAREDTRDVLVGRTLDTLRDGDRIGTGSPRRALQLAELAQRLGIELEVVEIRGNVDTRIDHAAQGRVAAVVLAAAGLRRLDRLPPESAQKSDDSITAVKGLAAHILSVDDMIPAPGQGALALEIHESLSQPVADAIRSLDDLAARSETLAERAFLATLEAGLHGPGRGPCRAGGCPWYRSRFDSARRNWENGPEQLVGVDHHNFSLAAETRRDPHGSR